MFKISRLFKKKKRILVLGGGGARGFTSLGVLKALERIYSTKRLPFDMIIGTSMGSLIGAAYSLGYPVEELQEKASKFSWPHIIDLGFNSTGLVKGEKLEEVIRGIVDGKHFSDMRIPFAITSTDIITGEELIHTSGDLVKLIRASCSWPGIVSAVKMDERLLVDGGVRNSIPTKAAREFGATFIFAVDPGFGIERQKPKNAFKALVQSLQIMGEELNAYQSSLADIVIKPDLADMHQFDFDKAGYMIKQGEIATFNKAKEIRRKLR